MKLLYLLYTIGIVQYQDILIVLQASGVVNDRMQTSNGYK